MKKRIAILYPAFMGGGAEAVCLWMLEALKSDYELTLFTFTFGNFQEFNRLYGTNLSDKDIRVICPIPKIFLAMLRFILANINPFHALRQYLLSRFFKNFNGKFDLAISAYNEMDVGQVCIQYIHWINVVQKKGLSMSAEGIKENITLTNSECVAGFIKKEYGIDARVVYPPVISDFPDITREEKEDGFLCIGRLVEAKSWHIAIDILKTVRAKGFDVHLHIIGSGGNRKYIGFLKKLQKENSSWLFLEEDINHKDFCCMLAKHKYGIHTKKEPFGIVVAEMLKAGCIPFVRSEGGQIEIIGSNKWLMFENDNDAVEKIVAMLSSQEKQRQAVAFLAPRKELFSETRFMREIRGVVNDFFIKREINGATR